MLNNTTRKVYIFKDSQKDNILVGFSRISGQISGVFPPKGATEYREALNNIKFLFYEYVLTSSCQEFSLIKRSEPWLIKNVVSAYLNR